MTERRTAPAADYGLSTERPGTTPSTAYLHEPLTLDHLVGFAFIGAGAVFVFVGPL